MSALNEGTDGAGAPWAGRRETRLPGLSVELGRTQLRSPFPPPPRAGEGAGPGLRRGAQASQRGSPQEPGRREDKGPRPTPQREQGRPAPRPCPGSSPAAHALRLRGEGARCRPRGRGSAGLELGFGSRRGFRGTAAKAGGEAGSLRPSLPAARRALRGDERTSHSAAVCVAAGAEREMNCWGKRERRD